MLRQAVQPLCKFRQFADVKDAAVQGKGKGDTFHWNVYSDIATQGTVLVETTTMPESNFTITQGTMTITEFGNSVPYTGKLDGPDGLYKDTPTVPDGSYAGCKEGFKPPAPQFVVDYLRDY